MPLSESMYLRKANAFIEADENRVAILNSIERNVTFNGLDKLA